VCSATGTCELAESTYSASCTDDADCSASQFCYVSSRTCAEKLAAGAALPGDGAHSTCSASHTNSACETGHCNADKCTALMPYDDGQCSVAMPGKGGHAGMLLGLLACALGALGRRVRARSRTRR
jgi:hypothetical protein